MPLPPEIGPLITAAGPFGAGGRVVGVVDVDGPLGVDDVVAPEPELECDDDDEHAASTVMAATAAPRMTCVLRAIPGVSRAGPFYGVRMDDDEMRRRVADARVARLATVTADGRPHIVPCCFVLTDGPGSGQVIYSAVDAKPKSTNALRRLANLRANPHAALLVDHYSDDWSTLWWVRVDGEGRVLAGGDEHARALALLAGKYPVYVTDLPPGAVVAIDVVGWRAWP